PFSEIQVVVERGLGRPIAEAFLSFDPTPLATASIGQTHRAVTLGGDEVVVKVQRPGIEQTIRGDLSLLFMLSKALEVGIEEMRLLAPSDIVVEFERALLRELDFTEELHNLERAREFIALERQVKVPKPYPELSVKTVLTMEYFAGKSLRRVVPKSEEAKHAVTEVLHSACKQVLIDGFFHGDPHAGNILINEEGMLCMIDLGLVGSLRDDQRADIISLMIAMIAKDAATIARVMLRMGTPLKRINMNEFKGEITRILNLYLNVKSFSDFKSRELVDDFVNAAQHFQIKLASEYSVLMKAVLTIEGLVRNLYPDIDAIAIAQPYIRKLVADRFSPSTLMNESMTQLMGLPNILKQLPGQIDQILHDAETGNLQVRSLTPQLDLLPSTVHYLGSRLALTAFAFVMTIAAIVFIAVNREQALFYWLIGLSIVTASVSWSIVFLWHFVQVGKPYRATTLLQFLRR
ncbi:MAG: AarF/ABC1/UbiB kinase family protein, partial [Proteobacteria bacterium]